MYRMSHNRHRWGGERWPRLLPLLLLAACGDLNPTRPAPTYFIDTGRCFMQSNSLQVGGVPYTGCRMHLDGPHKLYNWQLVIDPNAPWTLDTPPAGSLSFTVRSDEVPPVQL